MPLSVMPTETAVPRLEIDRSQLTAGILHFGLGNFHRAHQAMYLDRLMQQGQALDWGICGVGVMPGDVRMRDVIRDQDGEYTLVLRHPDGSLTPRVIGSVVDFLFAPEDPEAVLARLEDEAIRIVSLTVTEGGYNIDRTTGEFDTSNPAIQADAANPQAPATVFGLIVEGLRRRRAAGRAPFTVMSCDNVPGNGEITRGALTAYARLVDAELADWIESDVAFPNSMVDRITPVTTDADRALVTEKYGIADAWPVMAEPFEQWVLEDHFPLGRPAFEEVGVQLVEDVVPYELMKLRLLNAGHQALAYAGFLRGYTAVHDAMHDAAVEAYLRRYWDEARPTLDPVPGIDLDAYVEELTVRFGNPEVADTLARLAFDASDRVPKFVLPAVRDNLEAGRDVTLGAALVAMWAQARAVKAEAGYEMQDAMATELDQLAARQAGGEDLAFLQARTVFGDLADQEAFTGPYVQALHTLQTEGVDALLARLG